MCRSHSKKGSNKSSISLHSAVGSPTRWLCFCHGEWMKCSELQRRGECCIINSAAGEAEDFDLLLEFVLKLSPLRNVHPTTSCVCKYTCVCERVWSIFVCVFILCVSVLSNSDGKRPGSSSSFGTKGNMTQMDAISPQRLGPAAQETHREKHSYRKYRHALCSVSGVLLL